MSPPTSKPDGASTDVPLADEITYNDQSYHRIREGLADILNPRTATEKQSVFYNPIQQFNRDLSVLAVRVFAEDLSIIRRARHERRLQNLAKAPKKGNKRKQEDGGHGGEAKPVNATKEAEDAEALQGKKRKRADEGQFGGDEDARETKKVSTSEASLEPRQQEPPIPTESARQQQSVEDTTRHGPDVTRKDTRVGGGAGAIGREEETKKRKRGDEDQSVESEDVRMTKKVKSSDLQEEPLAATQSAEQQQITEDTTRTGPNPAREDGRGMDGSGAPVESTSSQVDHLQNGRHQPEAQQEDNHPPASRLQNNSPASTINPFRVLDALSATGLRALRYASEVSRVTHVTANDLSSSAIATIKLNVAYNELGDKIAATTGDAKVVMRNAAGHVKDSYHVVDLDPYGTAAPFLDAAVQAVTDGGLLCVTCTDSGVFASVAWSEKTYSQYGGLPWKGPQNHEAGLRLILHAVATSAARYGLAAEPLLSLNIDFYVRLFVRIKRAPVEVKCLAGKTMVVYNCDHGCGAFTTQYLAHTREREAKNGDKFHNHTLAQGPTASPRCEHCGFKTHLAGPMWGGPLHNPHFISRILDLLPSLDNKVYGTLPRIEGMLTLALHETLFQEPQSMASPESASTEPIPPLDPALRDPHPFFFNPSTLSRTLHCSRPSDAQWRGALLGLGYRMTRSHTEPGSIRTDAPWHVIWEIMREWVRQKHPIKEGAVTEGMAGWEVLRKDRSRRRLNDEKQELRAALDKAEDLQTLRKSLEAALYRISEKAKDAADNQGLNDSSEQARATGVQAELRVVFDEKLGREIANKKMVRYQMNPRAEWGPMSRAKGGP
ncbi:MAG: hypothetical protein L6R39_000516 [Caloplaca ligustica]|nr:MAG: hypothetical protein L6R39_000516 [Caloplaca ligustica]